MSDSESEEESEPEIPSLDDVQNEFFTEVGHKPHTVKQLLAYCKQHGTGHKFKDINQWWPNRPEPEEKPQEAAVNADDYKDANEMAAAAKSEDEDDDDDDDEDDDKEENEAAAAAKDDDGDDDGDKEDEEEDEDEEEEDADEEEEEEEDDGDDDDEEES